MAKKAKPKSTAAAAYDDDDSEDQFEEDNAATETKTELPKTGGGQSNAATEGTDPEPEFSIEQAKHYLKNVGHWHQFLTTIKQYQNNKIAEEKNAKYKATLSAHPTK